MIKAVFKFTLLLSLLVQASPILEGREPEELNERELNERELKEFQERAPLATIYSSCKNNKQVALTFDDGPYIYEHGIVDLLSAAGAKGTFFVNGNNYECIYSADSRARVKYAYSKGHMIGSHTWAHLSLPSLSFSKLTSEMARVDLALQRIIGVTPAFMRPPYGDVNNLVRQVARQRNESVVLWDLDSGDSLGATVQQSKNTYLGALASHPKNLLPLNHETLPGTAHQLVPWLIKLLQSRGINSSRWLNV
ncbi:uncharacterized protein EI90DRAFT_3014456 [Cantharellus anzutake]|uniref:uncharacterized protein n=1 Tax=Cantharellus anzutake TaxID=1750568 RepID=UPI0019069851|nr:uncharacterized protein EI90DRAFT_3014456 [Cantharellus anzutake]KAF8335844.1 hypothetical protein EI90DRAFT_3014456 [Cantharellus anzutake]